MSYKEYDLNLNTGDFFGKVKVKFHDDGDVEIFDIDMDQVCINRRCAIAAARAILKHFDAMPGLVGKEEW